MDDSYQESNLWTFSVIILETNEYLNIISVGIINNSKIDKFFN